MMPRPTKVALRPCVGEFANAMETTLRKNGYKGDRWMTQDPDWLFARLVEEVGELAAAVADGRPGIADECIDVANFAMMLRGRLL